MILGGNKCNEEKVETKFKNMKMRLKNSFGKPHRALKYFFGIALEIGDHIFIEKKEDDWFGIGMNHFKMQKEYIEKYRKFTETMYEIFREIQS